MSGAALSTISGLSLTTENYKEAIILLENQFGNQQVQRSAHMDTLLKIKKVTNMDNLELLRKLYNDVEYCVRNLKTLKVDMVAYGDMLIPVLNKKLPDYLRILISRKFGNDVWTLDNYLLYLNEEIQAIERCQTFSKKSDDGDGRGAKGGELYTTQNLFAANDGREHKKRCAYCLKDHPASKCGTVTNVEARIAILRRYGKCFVCLQGGHRGRSCRSTYKCKKM